MLIQSFGVIEFVGGNLLTHPFSISVLGKQFDKCVDFARVKGGTGNPGFIATRIDAVRIAYGDMGAWTSPRADIDAIVVSCDDHL